ncbi:transcription-repair coupling factor (superfamily II helicase) [Rhodobium gokarnense]|uniref:Transcription-repair-coupling factor n=2 Tax=Rhodobium gokarnense TaxID=364296 RepID=A0ABT3HHJ9_9HYPH|nr:transcription-repair coupling factor [Rhodobium gokarnense]MCW2309784.1 transcription-repair coupling factor (superfamily II helicase) [Rhodobium gokarnense]
MTDLSTLFDRHSSATLAGVVDGLEAMVAARLTMAGFGKGKGPALAFVVRDGGRMAAIADAIGFFAPSVEPLILPAWDCLPYDRVSPNAGVSARRMATLARLAHMEATERPVILLTTANALLQRLPPRDWVAGQSLTIAPGNRVDMSDLTRWLESNGFQRSPTVREAGEYAVRGGIVDLYAAGTDAPLRLDFFGDTLESIRPFDPETQRSTGQNRRIDLVPTNEIVLNEETVARFRQAYRSEFGGNTQNDMLYQAVSEGRRYPGMEHWLPLFYERLDTLDAYLGDAPVLFDALIDDVVHERHEQIEDHYQARREAQEKSADGAAAPYKPLHPDTLYLTEEAYKSFLADRNTAKMTPFGAPEEKAGIVNIGGRVGRSFAAERASGDVNVFDALVTHVRALLKKPKRVVVASWSEGARDRLQNVLADHGLERVERVGDWQAVEALPKDVVALVVLGVETGFETGDFAVIGEQDVLGDRLVRSRRKSRRAQDFLSDVTSLAEGDLVVHVDHGIGRFVGLKTIEAAGAPHDCLDIRYHGDDKLYLPVENIELLTRYGSEETEVQLDRLGGGAWQARKARMKARIREIADGLIKTAAARAMKTAEVINAPEGLSDEFAAKFPYEETEDQLGAIEAVLEDLGSGRPADRLVCGDVGFGKTEVALRAAFAVAMSGRQVAVIVPTTLLSRQHFKTFQERFRGLPLEVAQASRLVGTKEMSRVKAGLTDGTVDIVVGTHALLGKAIKFRNLGLLIVDEEQHFGVKHKERLKELKTDVHVLTLTATPIPRTLQLALSGVREMSIIATPPVDRLAVRTFISPFDPLVVREALLRERYRGGQSFYVCPRISDLGEIKTFLDENVPEVKVAVAHGQMTPGVLEDIMTAFYEGRYDVLLSTTIVESGLDIPTANTLIVHRADMFGLAQLYQLRGRVGRSKVRAYSLFTVPADRKLTPAAERRLKVLESLDTLGAGFQLASHDLDIRGAGNLVGEEQSGHIREVGYELYQQMLEEAVASQRAGGEEELEDHWSPQISVGTPVMIPESYVPDLQLRLNLYRRLGDLGEASEIDAFGAEMIDRFGPMPDEVEHLLKIMFIKGLCRKANVEKIDAGPKGVVVSFRKGEFENPAGLVRYITEQGALAKIRPDQRVFFSRDWPGPDDRLKGAATILTKLARLADDARKAA